MRETLWDFRDFSFYFGGDPLRTLELLSAKTSPLEPLPDTSPVSKGSGFWLRGYEGDKQPLIGTEQTDGVTAALETGEEEDLEDIVREGRRLIGTLPTLRLEFTCYDDEPSRQERDGLRALVQYSIAQRMPFYVATQSPIFDEALVGWYDPRSGEVGLVGGIHESLADLFR